MSASSSVGDGTADHGDDGLALRVAVAADEADIAALHAASWRHAYRDILDAGWLDAACAPDRRALWRGRFAAPDANQRVIVARAGGGHGPLAGFACLYLDVDPVLGTLLDNLHVAIAFRGRALGERLLRDAAAHAEAASPGTALHLSVVRANAPARRFYDRLGAQPRGDEAWDAPDGRVIACAVLGWDRAASLAAGD